MKIKAQTKKSLDRSSTKNCAVKTSRRETCIHGIYPSILNCGAPRTEDCVGCKGCESARPTDFLSVRVSLWHETTRSMGLAYLYVP